MSIQVLVPLDGSEFSEQALSCAEELVVTNGGVLHIVKVYVPTTPELVHLDELQREADRDYLHRLAEKLMLRGLPVVTAQLNGYVATAVEKYARTCGIQLIVMSTHGRGGLTRAWVGSVADELVRKVELPVLLLRPEGPETDARPAHFQMQRILLPVDGSEYSEKLIDTAMALGARSGAHFTLLQVLQPPPPLAFGDGIPVPIYIGEEELATARARLDTLTHGLRARGYHADSAVVVQADVADAIRTYAGEAGIDLIAMVTHGRSGWKRIVLGSITDQVMRKSSVPILVLRPDISVAREEAFGVGSAWSLATE